LQYARETGLRVSDIELDAAIRRIAENNKLGLAEFRAALERDGLVWPKFREEIREEIVLSRLRDREVESRIVVSDGEIDNYLANSGTRRGRPKSKCAMFRIIVIRDTRAGQSGPVDADRRAGAIRARPVAPRRRLRKSGRQLFSDAPDGLTGGVMGMRPIGSPARALCRRLEEAQARRAQRHPPQPGRISHRQTGGNARHWPRQGPGGAEADPRPPHPDQGQSSW
jgi:peptidyl-prolyl cis-trans isomerase SurA